MARIVIAWRYAGEPFGVMLYASPATHINGAPGWCAGTDPAQAFTFPNRFRAARWYLRKHAEKRRTLAHLRAGDFGHCFSDLDASPSPAVIEDNNPRQCWRTGQYHLF